MSTTTTSPPAGKRKLSWGLILILGLTVLYFLFSGPALLLAQRRVIPTEWVMVVYFAPYAPFQFVCELIPGADRLGKRYVEMWAKELP